MVTEARLAVYGAVQGGASNDPATGLPRKERPPPRHPAARDLPPPRWA
jgi:hypothetical protein